MAILYRNNCCNCAVPGYPCTGEHKKVPYLVCDNEDCKKEVDELYKTEYGQLCESCLLKRYEKVEVD